MQQTRTLSSAAATRECGALLGRALRGGEVFELVGDVGAGKTTFTKGLSDGMGITDIVQSPTFTISRVYDAPSGLQLCHYDFYRLQTAGIMREELDEALQRSTNVVVLEWSDTVKDVLPADRVIRCVFTSTGSDSRSLQINVPEIFSYVNREGR